jgi:hypothetical protein
MSLGDITPAEMACVDLSLGENKWKSILIQSINYKNVGKNRFRT